MTAVPSALDSADAKLLATEFDRLPAGVQRLFLAPPLLSATVQPADAGFALADPAALDRPAPQALLPRRPSRPGATAACSASSTRL